MASAERERGDLLNDHLDALVAGDRSSPRDLDAATTEVVRRFFARDDAPTPPPDLTNQIWEDVMHQTALAGPSPFHPSTVGPPVRHGRTQPGPRPHGRAPEMAPPHPWRPGIARFAAAALLLVALGLGYAAFGPFRPGPDRPRSIPAAVAPEATPGAPAATPSAVPFPMTDHPIIGVWQWDYDPCAPGTNLSSAIFDADGTYVEYQDFSGVAIGRWRATGERTVEAVAIDQHPASLGDLFEPDAVLPSTLLTGNQVLSWRAMTIDETGNRLTATGYYEPRNADGSVIVHLEYGDECNFQLVATRMVVDPAAPEMTPAVVTPTS